MQLKSRKQKREEIYDRVYTEKKQTRKPTSLTNTTVDKNIIGKLQKFNIRYVEQLLFIKQNPRKITLLAKTLSLTRVDLISILEKLAEKYPQSELEPIDFPPQGLGLII